MKQLREENARLKKLVADLSLDKDMLQSVIRKTHWARRTESGSAAAERGVSYQRAPRLADCAMNASTLVGFGICSTGGGRSVPGASNTTVRGRIPLSVT